MSQAPTVRALLVLAWPVVLARSTQAVIGFCDALMTAPLGTDALAAVTTGSVNVFTIVILPMGLAFVVQSFAAQLEGKGERAAASRYAWYGLGVAAASGVVAALMIPWLSAALSLFSYTEPVHRHMTGYLELRLLAVGPIIAVEVLGNWYGGLGRTRVHMVAGVVTMVVNVVFNWLLIEGNWGAPALGVRGAAIASVIAALVGFVYVFAYFLRERSYPTSPRQGLRWSEMARLIRFGLPNGVNWFLEFAAMSLFINVIVADLGTDVLAAMMVVFNINSVAFMPGFGISSAGAILVGQAIGKQRLDDVARILWLTILVAGAWEGLAGLVYLTFPATLMGWFAPGGSDTSGLLAIGAPMLALSSAWLLFDAAAMATGEALRAAGDTTWTMWARIAVAWFVFAPFGAVTVKLMGGGPLVATSAFLVFLGTLAVVLLLRFRSGAWRRIDLTGMGPPPDATVL